LLIQRTLTHQATKRRLDMAARATEPVIEIEMPKGGVEIVPPHVVDDAAAEPDAFRIGRRSTEHADGFRKLVDLLLLLGQIRWRRLLVRGLLLAALGKGGQAGEGDEGSAKQ